MERTRLRSCLLLVAAVAIVAFTPALASAVPPRASVVTSDAFEPDDTTATAKPFSTVTLRTLSLPGDQDWSYVDIVATGTPIMSEFTWKGGWGLGIPAISVLNPDGTVTGVGIPGMPFGGAVPLPTAFLARAPKPGRYFVGVSPAVMLPAGGGYYELFEATKQIRRVAGGTRFSTAVAVSKKMWPTADSSLDGFLDAQGGAPAAAPQGCIVTTARNFADALAAGAWISKNGLPEEHMPILLTEPTSLNPDTAAEIIRLAAGRRPTTQPFTVYVIGGPLAVSDGVKTQIQKLGASGWAKSVSQVVRIGGATRFDTAAAIAAKVASSTAGMGDTVFITNGFAFADALSAGPVAGRANGAILGVTTKGIPPATAAFIQSHPGITKAVVVGGPSVVGTAVASALAAAPFSLDVTRVAGPNRYATSRALAEWGVTHYAMIPISEVLVTGSDFPDGLAAAGLTGFTCGPVLLTPGAALSDGVKDFFAAYPPMWPSYMVGGPSVLSNAVEAEFDALRPPAP